MNYNYEDVNCPYCQSEQRVRFAVKTVPFGPTSIVSESPVQCPECKEYYMLTVKTIYGTRKLNTYEQKQLNKL